MRQGTGSDPDGAAVFEEWRSTLFGVAYRMLGTASEAEDVVQETYLRWRGTDRAAVVSPAAWLTKAVTNLCLNQLSSARVRRERYVGQWLPEPVLTRVGTSPSGPSADPVEVAEQRDAISLALLVLLERLTPPERAVFVLREAFGYAHREVADVLGVTEPHSRQLYRRAKRTVSEGDDVAERPDRTEQPGRPGRTGRTERTERTEQPERTERAEQRERPEQRKRAVQREWPERPERPLSSVPGGDLLSRFLAAARDGDLAGLERLLADDVVSYADGGGTVGTARRPIVGRTRVARYLTGGMQRFATQIELTPAVVNGGPALLGFAGGQLLGVLAVDVSGGRISTLHVMANPDKLIYIQQQLASLSHPRPLPGQ
ncbi:sigma-70 family RNA polymerase sigma factor [Streptomyces iconiensis]|uniref:Sigma-70 family RNA polymerase sigma factor n=1 Tax=Streptomyces iconiensis TaxID=1384038 RepID=A0ABT6ZS00_9ACTN|nr:sigma-70 family RNA polymerase sigma factor [Streptomyces iconiensis]MDJ1131839.1 sigma-70 family RNA polymerase sigma factor [Streptomyces iconiensis]